MTETTEPTEFRAGDTLEWTTSLPLYPATLWTLSYEFRNSTSTITITATADGTDHAVSEDAATTAAYDDGDYAWVGQVVDIATGAIRHTVSAGNTTVQPDLAAGGAVETRTYARITLDAIEAVIQGRASKDQESYSIRGRQLARTPLSDLLEFLEFFRKEVAAEEEAESTVSGKKVVTVF